MRAFRSFLLLVFFAATALARVDRIDITTREDVLGGKPFGGVAYEKIAGKVHFKVRPEAARSRAVVDLELAPRDANGEVAFSADFYVLRPKNGGNGALLLEIPNRGGKGILAIANQARGSLDPTTAEEFGDGFLMRRGFTVAWLGWQWDVRDEAKRMRLDSPVAMLNGKPITGLVRSDFLVTEKALDQPLGHVISGTIGGTEYEAADPANRANVLTVRDAPLAPRQTIPRAKWSFAADRKSIHFAEGFVPGRIYELIYVAKDPRIAGLGFAAVRDFVSYAKHDPSAVAPVRRAEGVGISQSGRFLRHFLYEGFNADEEGRQVFDGIDAHVAGAGRGNFNYRFAQPSRDAQPRTALFYATDLEPFGDAELLAKANADGVAPKLFLTNTSYEYWSRAASLIHTTPDGTKDVAPSPNVRIYHYAGLQHFSGRFPAERNPEPELAAQQKSNPLPVAQLWRAAIVNLDEWVANGTEPPPSRYPSIADGTLVPLNALKFPKIDGLAPPRDVHQAYKLDLSTQPPRVGAPFVSLVPQVDEHGNDLGGIRLPQLVTPLATYTGWNLRDPKIGAPDVRVSFLGSYVPFTPAKIAALYRDRNDYLGRFTDAALQLIHDRYLLAEDLTTIVTRGAAEWEAVR
jgi:hypothetical protein